MPRKSKKAATNKAGGSNAAVFKEEEFCSAKGFQLAQQSIHLTNKNDMGKKSGKKKQWTIRDVKTAIKKKDAPFACAYRNNQPLFTSRIMCSTLAKAKSTWGV